MKLVINDCYGGFGLSKKALEMLYHNEKYYEDCRYDQDLIKVVEMLGDEASGAFSELIVVEIPDDSTDYDITEYDGLESVIYVQEGKIKYLED